MEKEESIFEIKINEQFKVTRDPYNFILNKVKTVKDEKSKNYGKEIITGQWYYGKLEAALLGFVDHCDGVQGVEIRSVQDYIKEIKTAKMEAVIALNRGMKKYEQENR